MKDLYIERERFKNNVSKLNPPVFQVDLVEPPKQKFWLHQMEVTEHADTNSVIRSVILTAIVLVAVGVLWVYSNDLQALFK